MTSDVSLPPPNEPPDGGPPPIPWETPGLPFLTALIDTVKLFVTDAGRAFSRVPVNSDILRPLLYAIIIGTVGALADFLYNTAFGDVLSRFIPTGDTDVDMQEFAWTGAKSFMFVVLMPLLIIVTSFIAAGITHLVLILVGGNNRGFFATYRVVCYSGTSNLGYLIPICGGLLVIGWNIFLSITGLSRVHGITTGKAALAVLLPLALVCVCMGLGFLIFGAALMATLSGQG